VACWLISRSCWLIEGVGIHGEQLGWGVAVVFFEEQRAIRGRRLDACLAFCGDAQIERRPRGASRLKPLLHLLQRAMA